MHPSLISSSHPYAKRRSLPADDNDPTLPAAQLKRRKYADLEHSIAHLSLNPSSSRAKSRSSSRPGAQSRSSAHSSAHRAAATPSLLDAVSPHVSQLESFPPSPPLSLIDEAVGVLPGLDAPLLPIVEGSKMQSWYEPEKDRIVITDLDDFDDEPASTSGAHVVLSSAMEHIKSASTRPIMPIDLHSLPPDTCTALVLYRPPISEAVDKGKEEDEPVKDSTPVGVAPLVQTFGGDDDVMEVDS